MNGVLSQMPPGILDPTTIGLMQAGLGLMSAGGPSRLPVSFGQAFGQAGQQGLAAYQQALQNSMQQQLFGLKMSEAEREAAERKKREEALTQFSAQFPQFAGIAALDPKTAIQRAFPAPQTISTTDPTGKPVQQVVAPQVGQSFPTYRPELDPNVRGAKLEDVLKQAQALHPLRLAERAAGKTEVNVDTRQESKFSETVGKELGEQYSTIIKADMNAPAVIGKYQRLGQLLGQVNTGKFKGATTDLKAAAKSIGIDLNALGITDDVAPAQAARALSNQIALELRNPAGGAGMPGALSDKDREFLLQSIPGLENDPQAIGKMIEYRVKLEQRAQRVARMAREYRKRTGKFDEGFYDELQEWSEKNPLFPEASKGGFSIRRLP